MALVFFAGVASGFLNIMAGGGSLISLPVMILLGLPAATANGTNRVGILVSSLVGVRMFSEFRLLRPGLSIALSLPAVLGAVVGSAVAVNIDDRLFNRILSAVMVLAAVSIMKRPPTPTAPASARFSVGRAIVSGIVFFAVGLYGGFIQAGVGLMIMFALSLLTPLSLVQINSVKVFVIGAYMIPSLAVFVVSGKVDWVLGVVLAAGMGAGAWAGTHLAVRKGERWIKAVLAVVVVAMAVKLSGVLPPWPGR